VRKAAWKRLITLDMPTIKQISMICAGSKCAARSAKVTSPMTSVRVQRWA